MDTVNKWYKWLTDLIDDIKDPDERQKLWAKIRDHLAEYRTLYIFTGILLVIIIVIWLYRYEDTENQTALTDVLARDKKRVRSYKAIEQVGGTPPNNLSINFRAPEYTRRGNQPSGRTSTLTQEQAEQLKRLGVKLHTPANNPKTRDSIVTNYAPEVIQTLNIGRVGLPGNADIPPANASSLKKSPRVNMSPNQTSMEETVNEPIKLTATTVSTPVHKQESVKLNKSEPQTAKLITPEQAGGTVPGGLPPAGPPPPPPPPSSPTQQQPVVQPINLKVNIQQGGVSVTTGGSSTTAGGGSASTPAGLPPGLPPSMYTAKSGPKSDAGPAPAAQNQQQAPAQKGGNNQQQKPSKAQVQELPKSGPSLLNQARQTKQERRAMKKGIKDESKQLKKGYNDAHKQLSERSKAVSKAARTRVVSRRNPDGSVSHHEKQSSSQASALLGKIQQGVQQQMSAASDLLVKGAVVVGLAAAAGTAVAEQIYAREKEIASKLTEL
jgi:hypothetical protein